MAKTRPFLKWAGNKYNCLNRLLKVLPKGKRLIEPFAGSGSVFMNTDYDRYVLAETNADLIYLFNTLKTQGSTFIDYCKSHFAPETNQQAYYYQARQQFNTLIHTPEKAALFLYLNRHGYNGLCRYNASGGYNVPFGSHIKPYFPNAEMHLFHQKSTKAEFLFNDFRDTFALAMPGDVVYCDPPYMLLNEHATHIPYGKLAFTIDDHIELANLAQTTATRGIPVIISNHDTEYVRQLYHKAQIVSFEVPRFINCKTNSRTPAKEVLAVFS